MTPKRVLVLAGVVALLLLATLLLAFSERDAIEPHEVLRTPDARFENLADYPFEPHYDESSGFRLHYLDEGDVEAETVVLLHGTPAWSYLFRSVIPELLSAGFRVIAPDLLGHGRSDKLIPQEAMSTERQIDAIRGLFDSLELDSLNLFMTDWGGLIGLRIVAEEPDRFARLAVSNTGLPDSDAIASRVVPSLLRARVAFEGRLRKERTLDPEDDNAFFRWLVYSQHVPVLPIGQLVQIGTTSLLEPEVLAAYEAPFPDERHKVSARAMPLLVTTQWSANRRAWRALRKWNGPLLVAFSDADPITGGGDSLFLERMENARIRHEVLRGGHFVAEDSGSELAKILVDFFATP